MPKKTKRKVYGGKTGKERCLREHGQCHHVEGPPAGWVGTKSK